MSSQKEADAPIARSPWLRDWLWPNINLECALKKQKQQVLLKMFSRIVSGYNH